MHRNGSQDTAGTPARERDPGDVRLARPIRDRPGLDRISKRDLYAHAARLGIPRRSRMHKSELARALELRGEHVLPE